VRIVASCWAIGRNSAEATNARLIRAVRTRRAALTFELAEFLAFLPAWTGFVVFLALDEADPACRGVELPEDCPAIGSTTKRRASAHASRGIEVGEVFNLISSLYAALALL
jgi:hypothetical protein